METHRDTTFGNDHLSKALITLVLPDLATNFHGDLLGLTVLDIFALRHQLPFSLSSAWEKLLTVKDILSFVINCGVGQGIEMTESIPAITTWLESKVRASLGRQLDKGSRSSLIAVLQEVLLDAQQIRDISAAYMHDRLFSERDSTEDKHDRQYLCRKLIEVAIETAENGPSREFRLEYRHDCWMGDSQAAESEIGAGEENRNDEEPWPTDKEGRDVGYDHSWEYGDYDDNYDDYYGDNYDDDYGDSYDDDYDDSYDNDYYSYRSVGSVS